MSPTTTLFCRRSLCTTLSVVLGTPHSLAILVRGTSTLQNWVISIGVAQCIFIQSHFLQDIIESSQPILVRIINPVPSERLQLTFDHLFSFLNLMRIKLHLGVG